MMPHLKDLIVFRHSSVMGRERGVNTLPWGRGSLKGRAGTWGSKKHLHPKENKLSSFHLSETTGYPLAERTD